MTGIATNNTVQHCHLQVRELLFVMSVLNRSVDDSWMSSQCLKFTQSNSDSYNELTANNRIFVSESMSTDSTYYVIKSYMPNRPQIKTHYMCIPSTVATCKQPHLCDLIKSMNTHLNAFHKTHTCNLCQRKLRSIRALTSHIASCQRTESTKYKTRMHTVEQQVTNDLIDELMSGNHNTEQQDTDVDTFKLLQETESSDNVIDCCDINDDDVIDKSVDSIHNNSDQRTISMSVTLLTQRAMHLINLKHIANTNSCTYNNWLPTRCTQHSDTQQCNIVRHGYVYRTVYDVNEIICVRIPRYSCSNHGLSFDAMSDNMTQQLERDSVYKTVQVYAFNQVLVTSELYNMIASINLVTLNESHVWLILNHQYQRVYECKRRLHIALSRSELHVCNYECYGFTASTKYVNEIIRIFEKQRISGISITSTKNIFQHHIVPVSIMPKAMQQKHDIITQHCSHAISIDNTFKVARMGSFRELATPVVHQQPNKRKYTQTRQYSRYNAQLMTVMSSNGYVVHTQVVPNGEQKHAETVVQYIVKQQIAAKKSNVIRVVSVDNASQIGMSLLHFFKQSFNLPIVVLQDIFHARQRITRELLRTHPQWSTAMFECKQMFSKLVSGEYTDAQLFIDDLNHYRDKYTAEVAHSKIGDMSLIVELGELYGSDDVKKQLLTPEQLVDYYNTSPLSFTKDKSNTITIPVLRKGGATAIDQMLDPINFAYLWKRTEVDNKDTSGTTGNEAFHRVLNGRMPSFGGIRTFDSAQTYITIIQYQYNTETMNAMNHNRKTLYWCELKPLSMHTIQQQCHDMLPTDEMTNKIQLQFASVGATWTDAEVELVHKYISEIVTGKLYKHTNDIWYFLSRQDGLTNKIPTQIKKLARQLKRAKLINDVTN